MTDHELVPRPLARMPPTRLEVYDAIADHGPADPAELLDRADVAQPTLYRAIEDMDDAGLIVGETVVNPHSSGVKTLWRLADDSPGDEDA